MKKLLYLCSAFLLVLISCSKDDDTPQDPVTSTLLKKSIIKYHEDGETITSEYIYDGKKIVNIVSSDTTEVNYTYTGDLITKIEYKYKEIVELTQEYTYTDSKLATNTRKWVTNSYDYKTVYTHNTDGTISYKGFKINKQTKEESEYKNGTYTLSGGNLTKEVSFYLGIPNQIADENTSIYEYDTKNLPSKNIIGFNSLIEFGETIVPFINNIIKTTKSGTYGFVNESTYTYNENGFPIEQKKYEEGDLYSTAQYFY